MTLTVTPAELMNRGLWRQAVSLLGIEQAVNEGRIKAGTPVSLTEAQAYELGLVPSRLDALVDQVRGDSSGGPESLPELFREVHDLAGQVADRISNDEVDARLRRLPARCGYVPSEQPPVLPVTGERQ